MWPQGYAFMKYSERPRATIAAAVVKRLRSRSLAQKVIAGLPTLVWRAVPRRLTESLLRLRLPLPAGANGEDMRHLADGLDRRWRTASSSRNPSVRLAVSPPRSRTASPMACWRSRLSSKSSGSLSRALAA